MKGVVRDDKRELQKESTLGVGWRLQFHRIIILNREVMIKQRYGDITIYMIHYIVTSNPYMFDYVCLYNPKPQS